MEISVKKVPRNQKMIALVILRSDLWEFQHISSRHPKREREKKENNMKGYIWDSGDKNKLIQFSYRTCCKHSQPLPYYYYPVISVLEDFVVVAVLCLR